ncbi:hypothetical protein GTZ97_09800 [Aquabacterium fontiphilum]|uniref:HNH endonuclease n=1 Tax=Aquabacterium fontiphilum TaxID=450365 RepID=UPI001378B055|nr:HNH endonuclease [Aquabacterium fontiphilum]NBD20962.1 hypothetical protein [Aquabacterium fontiphilum]
MPYCPYTNSLLRQDQCSPEHIIPLALGGLNAFVIPVDRAFNSAVGSKIDGAMANDFFILNRRNKHATKGHSGKKPVFVTKNARGMSSNRPLRISLDQHGGLKAWDPISKTAFNNQLPENITFSVEVDIHLCIRFCAKVALSAGQFVYGEKFQHHVKHDELRMLMNRSLKELRDTLKNFETLVDTDLQSENQPQVQIFRKICELASPYSVVGLVPSKNRLAVFVGVLGRYVGMLNAPAFTDELPHEGDFDLGQVIYLNPDHGLVKMSFRRVLVEIVSPNIKISAKQPLEAKNV